MLRVASVVSADSRWGKERGMVGYSSAGSLHKVGEGGSTFGHEVQVVRGDIDLAKDNPIGVVKLDLQGGELNAIYGMREIFSSTVKMAWIEMLANQTQIVELIQELGFYVFDTEYLFRGTPSSEALDYFIQSGSGELSSGSQIWKGIPIMKWVNFADQIEEYRSRFGLIQTDLLCLKPSFVDII